jgi:hypothetical protein
MYSHILCGMLAFIIHVIWVEHFRRWQILSQALVTLWNTRKRVLCGHASIQYTGTAVLCHCTSTFLLYW